MRVLALDTASPAPALALLLPGSGDGAGRTEVESLVSAAVETIPARLSALLSRCGLGPDAIERVAVLSGPGSFTGLRAGTAFARGLARALDVPLVATGTFRAAAAAFPAGNADLHLEAGRGEVHRARVRDGALTEDPGPIPRTRAEAEAAAAGVPIRSLDGERPVLAAALAAMARDAETAATLSLLYGRPSAAEERWGPP